VANGSEGVALAQGQVEYSRTRVDELLGTLRAADENNSLAPYLSWLGDDLETVYQQAIANNTWSQLESDVSSRFE
jgi:hypothetical protein